MLFTIIQYTEKSINISVSGLKTVNSDTEFERLLRKYGFETFGTGKLDIDKWPDEVFKMVMVMKIQKWNDNT